MGHIESALAGMKDALAEGVTAVEVFRGQTTAVLEGQIVVEACRLLRDEYKLNLLVALTAVDSWPEEPRFAVVYQLFSMPHNAWLGLKVLLPGDAPQIPSVTKIFPNADWHEREVFDMFGVEFTGHPDLRRILMPYDWVGHPLRKDYPLGYEEVQFSFNFDDIEKRKKYAKD